MARKPITPHHVTARLPKAKSGRPETSMAALSLILLRPCGLPSTLLFRHLFHIRVLAFLIPFPRPGPDEERHKGQSHAARQRPWREDRADESRRGGQGH